MPKKTPRVVITRKITDGIVATMYFAGLRRNRIPVFMFNASLAKVYRSKTEATKYIDKHKLRDVQIKEIQDGVPE